MSETISAFADGKPPMQGTKRTQEELRDFLGLGDDAHLTLTGVVDLDATYERVMALLEFALIRLREDDVATPACALKTGFVLGMGLFSQQLHIADAANPAAHLVNEIMSRDPNPAFGQPMGSKSVN